MKFIKAKLYTMALAVVLSSAFPTVLRADEIIEKGGVAIGVTVGNFVFLPAKYASVTIGWLAGAASYVLTGGNADLTKQIWRDTSEGPYLITPELARKSIGERPLLAERNQAAGNPTAGE